MRRVREEGPEPRMAMVRIGGMDEGGEVWGGVSEGILWWTGGEEGSARGDGEVVSKWGGGLSIGPVEARCEVNLCGCG